VRPYLLRAATPAMMVLRAQRVIIKNIPKLALTCSTKSQPPLKFEIERKFSPTPQSIDLLERNAGLPQFHSLQFLGTSTFKDIYYDHHGILEAERTWVRQRDGTWQAKNRLAGCHNSSIFEEVEGAREVLQIVHGAIERQHLIVSSASYPSFDLAETAEESLVTILKDWAQFETLRRRIIINRRFMVVLDETDFGHRVGEVELLTNSQQAAKHMHHEIDAFMAEHKWAFPDKDVVGKLSAYSRRKT
jgi:thiamine-triphosphatase